MIDCRTKHSIDMLDQLLVKEIIKLLQILQYDSDEESTDDEWVKFRLVTPGESRTRLMVWLLHQLCSSDDVADVEDNTDSRISTQKMLQLFYQLGLCKSTDYKLIEGTSTEILQLKFWLFCLQSAKRVKELSLCDRDQLNDSILADQFLDCLSHSAYLRPVIKETSVNLIPGDLQEKYKDWCKQGPARPTTNQLKSSQASYNELSIYYENMDKKYKMDWSSDDNNKLQKKLLESVSALTKQMKLFNFIYTSYISAWTQSSTQHELPNTGPIINSTHKQLNSIEKMMELSTVAKNKSNELENNEQLIHASHQSSIVTTLRTLANQTL